MAPQFQFDEDQNLARRKSKPVPGITGKLIGWGIVKTESQAQMIMLAIVVIAFVIIIYQNVDFSASSPAQDVTTEIIP